MSGVPRLQLWVSTYITDPWIPCLSSGIAASQSAFSKASALTEVLNYLLFFFVLAPFWNERWHSTYFGICDNSFNYYQSLTHISEYDYSPSPSKLMRIISLAQPDLWTPQSATQLCLRGSFTPIARYWFNYSHLSKSLWSFISPVLTLREINFVPFSWVNDIVVRVFHSTS